MANAPDAASQNPEAITQINRLRARSLPELEKRERELTEKLKLLKKARAEKQEALKRAQAEQARKKRSQILIVSALVVLQHFRARGTTQKAWEDLIEKWALSKKAEIEKLAPEKQAAAMRKLERDADLASLFLEV